MLILGSTLVAGAILLTALIALFFRRPHPPRWTRPDLVPMLVAVPLAGAIGAGLGYMLVGLHRLRGALDLDQVAGALAVWLVAAVLWHLLGVRARLRAYAAAARGAPARPGHPVAGGPPEQPAHPPHLHAA